MNDLDRLVARLIEALRASDPSRLRSPIAVSELEHRLVPYRGNRKILEVESREDYDLLLLRLLSEEGGLTRTTPDEIRDQCRAELASPNPDLSILERCGEATIEINPRHVERLRGQSDERSLAIPTAVLPLPPTPTAVVAPLPPEDLAPLTVLDPDPESALESPAGGGDPTPTSPQDCAFCGGSLPLGRVVKFCPHCGQNLLLPRCPKCGDHLEPGWRHCVTCGHALGNPSLFA